MATARRYMRYDMTIDQLFDSLNGTGIRYVVLRWFEKLPFINEGEDVDLLVNDDDMKKIDKFFSRKKRMNPIPFDIYSESGLEGSNYAGVPYFPPHIANLILKKSVLWNNKYFVPCPRHHFFSMAYHVVYHKGENSGLPIDHSDITGGKKLDHNYKRVLTDLANKNKIIVDITLKDLHQYLTDKKWRPSMKILNKLSTKRREVAAANLPLDMELVKQGELMVFIIREWPLKHGYIPFIIKWLRNNGLEIVFELPLNTKKINVVKENIRGGNWGKGGIYNISGGKPVMIIAAFDHTPIPVPKKMKKKYPYVTNGHFFIKEELRSGINKNFPRNKQANPIHSSDDDWEAWEFLRIACPENIREIQEKIYKSVMNC